MFVIVAKKNHEKTFISKKIYKIVGAVGGKGKVKTGRLLTGGDMFALIISFYSALLPSCMIVFSVLYRFTLSKG